MLKQSVYYRNCSDEPITVSNLILGYKFENKVLKHRKKKKNFLLLNIVNCNQKIVLNKATSKKKKKKNKTKAYTKKKQH